MPAHSNARVQIAALLLSGVVAASSAAAQRPNTISTLPATAPTSIPAASSLPAPIAATSVSPAEGIPRHRARVTYTAGLLAVQANNSSLNGILRDISQRTGMKITGGVIDQRVFGSYGPADPSTILATLLDGTGSNMLLKETATNAPAELVLTPRTGGITPPNPNAGGYDADPDDDSPQTVPQQSIQPSATAPNNTSQANTSQGNANIQPSTSTSGPQPIPQPFNKVLGSPNNTTPTASDLPSVQSMPTDSLSTPSTAQPVSGIVDSTNPPPAGSTGFGGITPSQPAATGAKTPEQIFQQLQALRQAQQQQSGTTPPTTQPQ